MPDRDLEEEKTKQKKSLNGRLADYEDSADLLLDKARPGLKKKIARLGDVVDASTGKMSFDEAPDDFVWKAMRDSFDPETNTVRDLKIDDRDLKRADNFYDFSINVSGKAIKPPFARQLWISYNLMGECCPRCTHSNYINDIQEIPVDMDPADLARKVTMMNSGVCPKCGSAKSSMILDGTMSDVNQLAMAAGQRAGKSSFVSTINAYLLHRFLKAPRLSRVCPGIQDFTPLTFTFVGLTAGRAIRLLWNPFVEIIKASEWFSQYFSLLDHYGNVHGKEYYKDQVLFYRFFTKNIDLYPMGPVKRTLRGDTRVNACVDEIGWFPLPPVKDDDEPEDEDDSREHANAHEVYASLDNSLMTVRTEIYNLYTKGVNHIPTGYMLNISSPQSQRDKIMSLVRESEDPDALSLGLQLATWEISPLYTRDHPVIRMAYRKNKVRAERDFGARPPSLAASIFPLTLISSMFNPLVHNSHSLDVSVTGGGDEDDDSIIRRTSARVVKSALWESRVLPPCIISADAGLTNNSFTIVVAYAREQTLVVPTILEIIPVKGTQINFPGVYRDVIKPLITMMNCHIFATDRWNSATTLQTAADDFGDKLRCIQRTLNVRDFSAFRSSVDDGLFEFPAMEMPPEEVTDVRNYKKDLVGRPCSHLFLQFLTTKQVNGVLVKGDGYTDDILRALAVAHSVAFNPKAREFLATFRTISGDSGEKTGVTRAAVFSRSRGYS